MAWSSSPDWNGLYKGDDAIINEVKKRWNYCQEWESQTRLWFELDTKFAEGDSRNMYQWDTWVSGDRIANRRPCLTINKTRQHNLLIINDAKQNKPGVNIRPVGESASFEAAQVFQEVVRHIEYISNAESVYDSATEFQVKGGFGYWRVCTDYISPKSRSQEIYIKRIKDPRSVYLDPDIDEVDGSDAAYGFIFEDVAKDLYDRLYPKFKDVGGSALWANSNDGWLVKHHVRVAEYYRKTQKEERACSFTNPATGELVEEFYRLLTPDQKIYFDNMSDAEKGLDDSEKTVFERPSVSEDIEWFKIAGNTIIDRGKWLGKYIPIVRLIGSETVIDGVLDRKGHTRAMLDAQRVYNINTPLALDTKLPTPNGWTTMGEVKVGDWLFDENGKPVEVAGTSPVFINRDCYKVEFTDNSHIIADAKHLWTVEERGKRIRGGLEWLNKTIPTEELISKKHFIWATKPLRLEEKSLPIHPYLLGAWLGDGDTANPRITASKDDVEEMRSIIAECGYSIGPAKLSNYGACSFTVYGMRSTFANLNLLGNKHIPVEYLRASEEQRLMLLRGLMDTDGCYSKQFNRCIFTNGNFELISSVCELLRSLGIRFIRQEVVAAARKFPNGETYNCKAAAHISFTVDPWVKVFELFRKAEPQTEHRIVHERRSKRHGIKSITKIASVPVKCVAINSESHLFLAGEGMIPTHNSANVEFGALQTKVPWLAPMAAVEGLEEYWKTANTTNHAWLPWNHIDEDGKEIPPPTRPAAPQSSPGYVQQMQIAQNEMMMVSGQYQAQMGENENAKSGVAINARQRQGDRATYHFIDNLAIAVRFTGKILIDLIPKVYDTPRVMRIAATDGSVMNVKIDTNAPTPYQKEELPQGQMPDMDKAQQMAQIIFNPSVGIYDVQSDTGPSFATRRQEAFNALTQIAASNKEFMGIAGDLLWKVADFPEAQALAERYRKIIPANVTGDAPDPQTEQMMHQAADQIQQLQTELQQMTQKFQDKTRELDIKEDHLKLSASNTMLDNLRADYKALNERITALGNSGPALSVEQIQPLIQQAIQEALREGGPAPESLPGIGQGGTPIVDPEGAEAEMGGSEEEPEEHPDIPGARKAPDGNFYLPDPDRDGKYLQVMQ